MDEFLEIFEMDLSEVEKIVRSFDHATDKMIERGEQEIELLQAMHDEEALVKERIKVGMVKHMRGIFADCYRRSTGKEAWNE